MQKNYLKYIISLCLGIFLLSTTQGYILGFKSFDNTIRNIQEIEETHNLKFPLVAFIFDPWVYGSDQTMDALYETLSNERIYHITVNGDYNAQEILDGVFDEIYIKVFKKIKRDNLRVIFRTMHEMNGGRYPRSGDPETFKAARKHIRNLSRTAGLDHHNILFDFSVNYRDMPSIGMPNQNATFIKCTKKEQKKTHCLNFEAYYPGDYYVDIIGFTFYNRGKGTSDRKRLTPEEIIYDDERNTLERIKTYNKPIIIDEVGTTAVYYNTLYNATKSKEIYNTERDAKNKRLRQLKNFLIKEPKILGVIYFNVDYTKGLNHPTEGEADRAVINLLENKTYFGIFDLYKGGNTDLYNNPLLPLFDTQVIKTKKMNIFVKTTHVDKILNLAHYISNTTNKNHNASIDLLDTIEQKIQKLNINPKHKEYFLEIVQNTKLLFIN